MLSLNCCDHTWDLLNIEHCRRLNGKAEADDFDDALWKARAPYLCGTNGRDDVNGSLRQRCTCLYRRCVHSVMYSCDVQPHRSYQEPHVERPDLEPGTTDVLGTATGRVTYARVNCDRYDGD